jgi:dihydroxyacetone kinase
VQQLDQAQIIAMLRAAAEGIKARGKSDVGDKTLLDALVPAVDALEERVAAGDDAAAAATVARERAEATRSMQAMRGRASYTGERSIGTLDAGAVAVAVMFEALANPDTLRYVPEYNLIMRTDAPSDNKVSIIQGSGSGHEPAHVMVVGKGMLDAACPATCSPRRRWTTCCCASATRSTP